MKKIFSIFCALLVIVMALGGCGTEQVPETTEAPTPQATEFAGIDIKIGALNGPTGMGISKLMKDSEDGLTANRYQVELFSAPTDITGLLINGELDIAAVPTNLAATLYNKTNGGVQLLALNTLGVLYVMEKGDTVHSIQDLAGKKIYSSGQASTPEYALNYVLQQNNITCEVEYFATHAELAAQALAGKADIILIPEPFVSTILAKDAGFRIAVDFNAAWDEACGGEILFSMGCLAVRTEFAQKNKAALDKFIEEYTASVEYVNANPSEAGAIIAQYGIVASPELAQAAIPNCNMVTITDEEMKNKTIPYIQMLFENNASSVGGKIPGEDFYYKK